ncbi:MAG: hypothetical protein RI897_2947 [Verrucomicrobiota bacterium]|jgi:ubiquinone/menaquinone biosynthesis C-methylase UbiE
MDPYNDPDSQADATLDAMMTRLEERGSHPAFGRMIGDYLQALVRDRPVRLLDLGCGTGVVTRRAMEVLHAGSEVHGADVSGRLLGRARELGAGSPIQWDHLQGRGLPYGEASFDVVIMHTVLSHVKEPVELLCEVGRVLRGGGQLIVFDADHASTTYGQPDYAVMRRVDHLLTSAIATNPDICRQLPRFLKQAGYGLERHSAEVLSECGRGDFWLSSVRGFARMIPALGILGAEEAEAWVGHMLRSHDEGTFFAAGAFYTFHARRV